MIPRMKKLVMFLAVAAAAVLLSVSGAQNVHADTGTEIESGQDGNCDWSCRIDSNGSYYLVVNGYNNGFKINDHSGSNSAPWAKYGDKVEKIVFMNIKEIGDYAFYGFEKLDDIKLDHVTRIGSHAFCRCWKVRDIEVFGDMQNGCVIGESAFEDCMNWESSPSDAGFIILRNVTVIGDNAFNECDSHEIALNEGLTQIGYGAFRLNKYVKTVAIPKSCSSIGDYAFNSCDSLESVAIKNPDCIFDWDSFDVKKAVLTLKTDSAALDCAYKCGYYQLVLFGNLGALNLDLDGKEFVGSTEDDSSDAFYLQRAFQTYAKWSMFTVDSENDGKILHVDLNNDGIYDLLAQEDAAKKTFSVKKLTDCTLGGTRVFRLSSVAQENLDITLDLYHDTFTIRLGKGSVQVPQGKNLTYDGTRQTGVAAGAAYTVSGGSASGAGDYEATVSLRDKANTTWADGTTADKKIRWKINKAPNPLKVKARTVKVKYRNLKKKAQKLSIKKAVQFTGKGQGPLRYKLAGVSKAKYKRFFKIDAKTGKLTIRKGLKKGVYKVKIKITAGGNTNYSASGIKKVTCRVKVK
ncbi:MAG: leucine-rich repeat protein [Eubacterium sp.]|nr:leucine-rich repeat protein [Eubacterium sp.]